MKDQRARQICVIEDDKDFINIVNNYMPDECVVTTFSWKRKDSFKFFFHQIIESDFDIYIIDINLPGISGQTLGSYIRESLGPEVLIIYTSQSPFSIDQTLSSKYNNNIYLCKPINKKALQASLNLH